MVGRKPESSVPGEIIAAAKMFEKSKNGGDGSFCVHDLMDALPHVKERKYGNTLLYNSISRLINNGVLTKLNSRYKCGSLDKGHTFYRYNNPFKKSQPMPEKARTVDLDTGRVSEPKNIIDAAIDNIKPQKMTETEIDNAVNVLSRYDDKMYELGKGKIREINISITDGELKLQIKKA